MAKDVDRDLWCDTDTGGYTQIYPPCPEFGFRSLWGEQIAPPFTEMQKDGSKLSPAASGAARIGG